MTTRSGLPVAFLVFGLCIPLAIFIGYMLATPTDFQSFSFLSLVFLALCIPLILKWHHFLLILCWNAAILVFFLPGQPTIGVFMAFASLGFSIWTRTMTKGSEFIAIPSLTFSLIFLLAVVLATSYLTGGIRGKSLGSEVWGGKRYISVIGAIVGYFALTARPIPKERGLLYASLFFLSGITAVLSDLAYAAGPQFSFLFAFFPSEIAFQQAFTQGTLMRLTGPSWAALAIIYFMFLRYGIQGIFNLSSPWRLLFFLALSILSLLGGFRSSVIYLAILFFIQFYYEGLLRTKLFPVFVLCFILIGSFVVGFADRLPLSIQRSLSFLPIDVHPIAKMDAAGTLDWRVQMWKTVLPDVPRYLFVGKGFSFSGTDLQLTQEAIRKGYYMAYEDTLVSGNYHNGFLTLIIPFGIFGMLGFVAFCIAGYRALRANYLYSPPEMKVINTCLLASFVARIYFYVIFYGQFDLDLYVFTGLVGLSVALNNGVRKASPVRAAAPIQTLPFAAAPVHSM